MSELDELDREEDEAQRALEAYLSSGKTRRDDEHIEQTKLFEWCRDHEDEYPDLRWFYAIPNGGRRHPRTAVRMKEEGVKAGVLDTHLPIPRGGYAGLWIEMKSEYGKLSQSQAGWIAAMKKAGHRVHIAYGADEAIRYLVSYLSGALSGITK